MAEVPVKRITVGLIISWVLGVFIGVGAFVGLFSNPLAGILGLAAAAILLPPTNALMARKLHIALSGGLRFILVLGLIIAMGVVAGKEGANTEEPVESPTPTASTNGAAPKATKTATPAPAAKSYQQVFTFSGNGAKKSEPFTIRGDRFKIKYDCDGQLCQAFLYKTNGTMAGLIMNQAGSAHDETIFYGAGEYYIDANTLGSYSMVVYDYR